MEVGMKKLVLAVVILLLLPSTYLFSQEWSAAQKDVWKNVEAYNKLGAERNIEGFMEYFHPDYCGWDTDDALPLDKAGVRKLLEESGWKTRKILYMDQKPVSIRIFGDVAIVHYYYSIIAKDAEGKEKSDKGRWTDILMKQGNKWVMIGDHGGSAK
jgi:ketosteroid isomerase-like protein